MSLLLLLAPLALAQDPPPAAPEVPEGEVPWGHSHLGSIYDEGPRRKPWRMTDVGEVHFPVTSAHPEVQGWFEQGIALMHSFWPFEAERAFRYCVHLDPDCAMAYWGLAEVARGDRADEFLEEAEARMDDVSSRERAYIELSLARKAADDAGDEDDEDLQKELEEDARRLADRLVMDYPDDIEALAFAALDAYERDRGDGGNRLAVEAMLQRILARDPDHVGALHYRIHNWDGEEGAYAIDSCMALTEAAPGSGHLQHMPGHVLSGVGMWHEAAIALDAATRVEQRYMNRRVVMPEDNWNYMHNLDYLAYVQGQLGMHDTAITTAQQLIVIPLNMTPGGDSPAAALFGDPTRPAIVRELLRAERWQDVLDADLLSWGEEMSPREQMLRHRAEAFAHLGLGGVDAAEESVAALVDASKASLKMLDDLPPGAGPPPEFVEEMRAQMAHAADDLKGLIALEQGRKLDGIQLLTRAAEAQDESWRNDPPSEPFFTYNLLGEALMELGSPALAAEAFERTLETVFHDGVALAGLVRAYDALGEEHLAACALAALEVAWSEADAGNRRLAAARATGVRPATSGLPERFAQPMTQRRYGAHVLAAQGPCLYAPTPAPALSGLDAEGQRVTLADHEGRTVLVFFYLGEQCTHCIEQLQEAESRFDTFRDLGVDVLAISKDTVEKIGAAQESFQLTLLSDPEFETAKRYGSYDDFEAVEFHSTVLIDPQGRIHYVHTGGDPFMEFDFLEQEARRLHEGGVIHGIRQASADAPAAADVGPAGTR